MKTLILEGIATSGKSTIIKQLVDVFKPSNSIKVVPETETLMNIVDNTDISVSIAYLTKLINKTYSQDSDIVIFDRLYLTHIFRTHSSMTDFIVIENMLRQFIPKTIFLEINESMIAERIAKASEHRDPKWKEYIYQKGQTIDEVASYYIKQQRNQLKILQQSTLPYKVFNTTTHEYGIIKEEIVRFICN